MKQYNILATLISNGMIPVAIPLTSGENGVIIAMEGVDLTHLEQT